MNLDLQELNHVDDVLADIEQRFFDIPFENSDYQNAAFVIAAQQTPGREYRAIGLRLFAKIQAVNHLRYERRLEDINIAEWRAKLGSVDAFERQRLEIHIERALAGRAYQNKLLNDAVHELNGLYAALQRYPAYTRAQFEAEEVAHFTQHLTAQIESGGNGALQSLQQMDTLAKRLTHE